MNSHEIIGMHRSVYIYHDTGALHGEVRKMEGTPLFMY
jgi:hypothetical protein